MVCWTTCAESAAASRANGTSASRPPTCCGWQRWCGGDLRATGDLAGPFRLIHGIREHTERVADAADWERVLAHHRSETDVGMGFTIQVPERELDDAAYEALSEEEIEALGQLREGDVLCEDRCCAIRGDIALQHGGGLYLAGACWVPTPAGKRLSRILFLDGM
jgi:hypothetical protein